MLCLGTLDVAVPWADAVVVKREVRLQRADLRSLDTHFWPGFERYCLTQTLWKALLAFAHEHDLRLDAAITPSVGGACITLSLHFASALPTHAKWIKGHTYVLEHFQSALRQPARDLPAAFAEALTTECHVLGCLLHDHDGAPDRYTLATLFTSLEAPFEASRLAIRDGGAYAARCAAGSAPLLTDLPFNIMWDIMRLLNAQELAMIAMVCTTLQHLTYDTVPRLRLHLYPHQKKALKWMLYRECSARALPHPYLVGDVIDPVLHRVHSSPLPAIDMRGGFLCDEPGLGKTITMIALLLRTQGARSRVTTLPALAHDRGYGLRSSQGASSSGSSPRLLASVTSLVIVPDTLVAHWGHQLFTHTTNLSVYIDDQRDLPSAEILTTYDVIVTTFGRISNHWQTQRPLETRAPARLGFEGQAAYVDGTLSRGLSPLLQVHWVRIIVDEGHKLGGVSITNAIQMLCALSSDKRWIMTGTPTRHVAQTDGLRHLHGLLRFLRDRPYGANDDKPWLHAIAKPFERRDRVGYLRLRHLLNRIMLRHVKSDVQSIPDPVRTHVIVPPSDLEYRIYNGVVGVIRGNLVVTKWDPLTPGPAHKDSLLNPENRRDALTALANLRLASSGGGQMDVHLSTAYYTETIEYLNEFKVPPERQARVIAYMHDAPNGLCTPCLACCRAQQFLMVVPCGHLLCADCIDAHVSTTGFERDFYTTCPACYASFDWEDFQKLQPGFDYKWDAQEPPETEAATLAAHIWSSSKGLYVLSRVTALVADATANRANPFAPPTRPIKVIIFSEFREHLFRVRFEFKRRAMRTASFVQGDAMKTRLEQLRLFQHDPTLHVLFLTEVGAVGLDLSFVTHIFLMDEVWDKSVEQQVIARAHRMGATGPVVVEQLEMRGSMETLVRQSYESHAKDASSVRGALKNALQTRKKTSATSSAAASERSGASRIGYVLSNVRLIEAGACNEAIVAPAEPLPTLLSVPRADVYRAHALETSPRPLKQRKTVRFEDEG
ncbi:hypothetical protein SDRG_06451 [Saprolegnia diclina VS20]|uniref:F-box protein n=1 Tax=Saprolegnia diclina (strain VS20) TaxID=1156394 RepID=T0QNP6_SAPDV|nr:hypothetical protein SDRG_06451 [Saprolegnia diclina VS20]EQC36346.1 hypothetical protein SDRG_06451 [Saprolegnia diclina VS20]|eukprot:XP_008610452.1 hypothetical protein SDRG_06451 [Saprolegnia diclina VS20]